MSVKTVVFVLVAAVAVLVGIQAIRHDPKFVESVWSELFWLIAAVLATTFFLDSILERSAEVRRRREDQFAFRTFATTVVAALFELVDADTSAGKQVMTSALAGNQEFAAASADARDLIAKATKVRTDLYNARYLDVASHLRSLSERYIRFFSHNHYEMLEYYRSLQALARRWSYRGALEDAYSDFTKSLKPDDPAKKKRDAEFARQLDEARQLLNDTAGCVAELAARVAAGAGGPSK